MFVRIHKTAVRFAISLGMLLGMTHGWVMADTPDQPGSMFINSVITVKSDTNWSPFSSDSYNGFPY